MGLHLFQMHGLISELKLDILKVMKFLGKQFWVLLFVYRFNMDSSEKQQDFILPY